MSAAPEKTFRPLTDIMDILDHFFIKYGGRFITVLVTQRFQVLESFPFRFLSYKDPPSNSSNSPRMGFPN